MNPFIKDKDERMQESHSYPTENQENENISNFPLIEVETPELLMTNTNIRNGFPFWERISAACMGCAKACSATERFITAGFTSDTMKVESGEITERMRIVMDQFHGKVVYLKIYDTGGLELDPHIIHPFVRVHVIDLTKNAYKTKSHGSGVVSYFEKLGQIDQTKKYHSGNCPFIPPFSTPPCDLRDKGENDPHWDEEFILDDDAFFLLDPNTVILFEILDFNFKLIKQGSNLLRKDKLYPIAWAFLRPVGSCKMHLGVSKLQLYKFKYKAPLNFSEHHRPEVLYNFNWYNKTKYPSFIRVELHVMPPPEVTHEYFSLSPFQIEVSEKPWEELEGLAERPLAKQSPEIDNEYREKQRRLVRWRKLPTEGCKIPNSLAKKFEASEMGCWRLAFSHNGKYLAAGCTDSKTVIKVFNVEDMEQVLILKGHVDLIHDIKWSEKDDYLLTSSTDGTAKLWSFSEVMDPGMEITGMTASNFNPGTAQLLRHDIQHPSYVFSGVFHPDQTRKHNFLIATACFDGNVRLWVSTPGELIKTNELKIVPQQKSEFELLNILGDKDASTDLKLLGHRHPNTLVFGEENILYIGDSLGMIHIYDLRVRGNSPQPTLIHQVELDEMLGDPINVINLIPQDDRMLIVQSRDNVIRGLEPPRNERDNPQTLIYKRFFGPRCHRYNIRSCVSPDGQYLLSGSEDGKLFLWDIATELPYEISNLEVNIKDMIGDVAWNPVYNMIAVAGFGSDLPVIVYVYTKTVEEIEENLANYPVEYQNPEMLVPHKDVISDLAYEVHGQYNY